MHFQNKLVYVFLLKTTGMTALRLPLRRLTTDEQTLGSPMQPGFNLPSGSESEESPFLTENQVPIGSPPFPTWRYCESLGCPLPVENEESLFSKQQASDIRIQEPFGSSSHCRLLTAFDRAKKGEKVTFAVVGGSASAGAGLKGGEGTWIEALQENSEKDFGFKLQLNNAAQGGTESFWAANMLDVIIDDADVLLWEFAINDVKGATTGGPRETPEYMIQSMEFFVRKALQLPSRPALVFVYLYDGLPSNHEYGEFYSTALEHQKSVLQRFADAGVDLLVVPVQKALRETHAENDMRATHHPGPGGHKAIAQLVAKQLQQAVQMPTSGCSTKQLQPDVKDISMHPNVANYPFLSKLLQMTSKSATPIKPHFGKTGFETLFCKHERKRRGGGGGLGEAQCGGAVVDAYGKQDPKRKDRKIGYDIPTCAGDRYLRIQLHNSSKPNFANSQILGMEVGGGSYKANKWLGKIKIRAEGMQSKVLDNLPISDVADMKELGMKFGDRGAYNLWTEIDGGSSHVDLCMPERGDHTTWGRSTFSSFSDGGGRVDWITLWS